MHVLHDDFLGLYFLLKEHAEVASETREFGVPVEQKPFLLNHRILLLDTHALGEFGHLFNFFTEQSPAFPPSNQSILRIDLTELN